MLQYNWWCVVLWQMWKIKKSRVGCITQNTIQDAPCWSCIWMCVCVNMRGLFNCMVFFQTHSWHKQAACLMDEKSRLKTVCHFWLLCLCSNHITCLLIPRHLTCVLAAINFNRCIYRIIKFWVLGKMLREVKKPHHLPFGSFGLNWVDIQISVHTVGL